MVIKLACEKHFAEQLGDSYHFDLADFNHVKSYRVHKKTPFEDFKETISNDLGIPKHLQRFWLWNQRQNGTLRISKPLEMSTVELNTVLDLRHFKEKSLTGSTEKNALMTIKLFLETPDGENLHPLRGSELLIFVKLYNPKIRKLSYIGHLFVEKTSPFRLILERAKKLAGLVSDADVVGFEEVKYDPSVICSDLSPSQTPEKVNRYQDVSKSVLIQSQFIMGDIIIIQERISDAEILDKKYEYPTVKSFLEFIQNSKVVNFKPLEDPKVNGITLKATKLCSGGWIQTRVVENDEL